MTTFRRPFGTSGCAAHAESDASATILAPQPSWKVVHCGVSRGVLYVTYIERGAAAITGTTAASPAPRPPRAKTRVEPTFTTRASGSVIAIDGRNDGDTAYRCVLNFSWTFDDDPTGPRTVTAQATLAARQVNRVVFISGPYRNVRFVGLPSWNWIAAD